jgi:hypothetical protein
MKFRLIKASDFEFEEEVEINSLEDLIALQNKYTNCEGASDYSWVNPSLVIDFNEREIIIYDYYIE